ncbi:head-tail joining protein [Chitinilyticum aquatile]|uniref:head-tail joining protein n=1 Tax=Chitinilyticum aquatile TaxID=362520 RepID=UPI00041E722F|nr:hypothetical protein [Chitinilyticum aquatile]
MTDDLQPFLADFGVPLTFGAKTERVLFDDAQDQAFGGYVAGRIVTIHFDRADFPGLDVGSAVTVAGRNWTLQSAPVSDGGFLKATLAEAP